MPGFCLYTSSTWCGHHRCRTLVLLLFFFFSTLLLTLISLLSVLPTVWQWPGARSGSAEPVREAATVLAFVAAGAGGGVRPWV